MRFHADMLTARPHRNIRRAVVETLRRRHNEEDAREAAWFAARRQLRPVSTLSLGDRMAAIEVDRIQAEEAQWRKELSKGLAAQLAAEQVFVSRTGKERPPAETALTYIGTGANTPERHTSGRFALATIPELARGSVEPSRVLNETMECGSEKHQPAHVIVGEPMAIKWVLIRFRPLSGFPNYMQRFL